MRFLLPIESLPQDKDQRYELLHEYFCDQRAKSSLENGHWIVETYWPPSLNYFADPNVKQGLDWWKANLNLQAIHHEVREMGGFQLSLNDSWTLYSWSKWLSQQKADQWPVEVVILHVDYHSDLMTPRITPDGNVFQDLLTHRSIDLQAPETVKNAILSGAIGVGSFMVPFLHKIKRIHLRHLCEGPLTKSRAHVNALVRDWENDTLLNPTKLRPSVSFHRRNPNEAPDNAIDYKITSDVKDWLSGLPDVPILLHIDMDYFNCRYDGDTDWDKHLPRHDPKLIDIETEIQRIFSAIGEAGLSPELKDIAVALSPGFFPAEFWEPGIKKVSEMIQLIKR